MPISFAETVFAVGDARGTTGMGTGVEGDGKTSAAVGSSSAIAINISGAGPRLDDDDKEEEEDELCPPLSPGAGLVGEDFAAAMRLLVNGLKRKSLISEILLAITGLRSLISSE